MKTRMIWLVAILISAWVGYSLGTSHNKPRFFINRNIVHLYISKPVKEPDFKYKADHWKVVKKRFNDYEDDSDEFLIEEDWYTWAKNQEGENIRKVKIIYNTISNEAALVCEKQGCPAQ